MHAGTGAHATELRAFASEGRVEEPEAGPADGAAGILYFPKHKRGLPHRVGVTGTVREAATQVRVHGSFSVSRYLSALRAASREAGVGSITSRLTRHTALTFAVSKGATKQAAGEFAGHTNVKTTSIYAQIAPPRVPTLI